MDFNEIASVSGRGGLFKVINPTRSGVILESLDDEKKKIVVGMQAKVSVLSDISIYTTDEKGASPLKEVMARIHKEFKGDTGLSSNSDPDELKSFLKFILPAYDEERVYVSDIKKLITWYNLLSRLAPELMEEKEAAEEKEPKAKKESASEAKKAPGKETGGKPKAKKGASGEKKTPKKEK